MAKTQELVDLESIAGAAKLPISVIIPVRNEANNLPRCLQALNGVDEVYVVDSQSTDQTVEIARSCGAKVVQFHYRGGWPKKRQWAMDTLPITHDWILLLDADEILTPALAKEIRSAIQNPVVDGYFAQLRIRFLGRVLRHGDVGLWKLILFRRGRGRYECRLREQDASMADMEIHEHVIVEGVVAKLKNPLVHENVESLSRYIQKHNEYSNWESRILLQSGNDHDLPASLFGTQAQRRRWLKRNLFAWPGSSLLLFLYRYVLRLGFLDGVSGLIYCTFQAVQMFHTKAKICELQKKELGQKEARQESMQFKSSESGNHI
jgi:glycosyltransferase involved in cell wall biosynthesis